MLCPSSRFADTFIALSPTLAWCFGASSKVGGLDRGADELQRQQGQAGREGGGFLQQEEPPLLRSEVRRSLSLLPILLPLASS